MRAKLARPKEEKFFIYESEAGGIESRKRTLDLGWFVGRIGWRTDEESMTTIFVQPVMHPLKKARPRRLAGWFPYVHVYCIVIDYTCNLTVGDSTF